MRLIWEDEFESYCEGDSHFRPKFDFSIDYNKVNPVKDDDGNRLYDAG